MNSQVRTGFFLAFFLGWIVLVGAFSTPVSGDTGPIQTTYESARDLYHQGDSKRALAELRSIAINDADTDLARRIHYLRGRIRYQREDAPLRALEDLFNVYERYERNNLTDDALYFIGDIYANRLNQPRLAVPYLQVVRDHFTDSDYHEEARSLFDQIVEDNDFSPTDYGPGNLPRPRIKLNFENIELVDFISTYSRLSGKNFTYQPNINGQITFISERGIPIGQMFNVFNRTLASHGFTVTREGDLFRVESTGNAMNDGVPVTDEQTGMQTKLFAMDGLSWNDVNSVLSNILPNNRNITLLESLNRVLITTRPDKMKEVERVMNTIGAIQKNDRERRLVELTPQYVEANVLVNRLNSLLQNYIDNRFYNVINVSESNRVFVVVPNERTSLVNRLAGRIDRDIEKPVMVEVIRLDHARAQNVVNQLNNSLNVMPDRPRSSNINLTTDQRLNAVVVSTVSEHLLSIVKQTIEELDRKRPESPSSVRVFPIETSDPSVVAQQVKNLLNVRPDQFQNEQIQVIPDQQQKAVVVSAESEKVFSVVEGMIENLDQESDSSPENIKIYRLEHADVEDVASKLEELVDVLPGEFPSGEIRIIPDQRQRAIIVGAESREVFSSIQSVIDELDREDAVRPNQHHVYKVKNTDAGPLAEKLNFLFEGGNNSDLRVTADEQTNSLIVSAPSEKFESIRRTIRELDNPRKQILVDVIIVEASEEKVERLGMELGAEAGVNGREALLGTNFGQRQQAQQGGLFGLNAGVLDSTGENLLSLINAYKEENDFNIISTSHLMANENEEASLSVGEVVPILQDSQTTSEGAITRSFNFENVGINLDIVPIISGDSVVTLNISQEIEEIEERGAELGAPTRRNRSVQTTVAVPDRLTLVLGGVLDSVTEDGNQRVPIFENLPLIGNLVGSNNQSKTTTNLLMFMTPYILSGEDELTTVTDRLRRSRDLNPNSPPAIQSDTDTNQPDTEPISDGDTLPELRMSE